MPTLEKATAILNKLKLSWHVSAGTMLGIHRDKGFLPHDTDLDIAVVLPWQEDHYELTKTIVRAFVSQNLPVVRFILLGQQPIQLVFSDLANQDTLVDLEFYYTGLRRGKIIHYKPEGRIIQPFVTIKQRMFRDVRLNTPDDLDAYLTTRYGDWETPIGKKGDWKDYTQIFEPWTL